MSVGKGWRSHGKAACPLEPSEGAYRLLSSNFVGVAEVMHMGSAMQPVPQVGQIG